MTSASRLARNVRELRLARGLTQQQMAKLAGLPRATWSNLESGTGNPTLTVLHAVCSAFQVSLEEIVAEARANARLYPKGTLPVRIRARFRSARSCPTRSRACKSSGSSCPRQPHDRRAAHARHPRIPDLRERRDRTDRLGRGLSRQRRATWSCFAATSGTPTPTSAASSPSAIRW